MEHVVSRADLSRAESSPSASPEPEILERFKDQFEFVTSKTDDNDGKLRDEQDDEALDFQLFAAPKGGGDAKDSTAGKTHRIRLRSPSIDPEKVGFVQAERDRSYYFARLCTEQDRRQLESAAVTGDQILSSSQSAWPGSAYAWKVLHLPPSSLSKDLKATEREAFATLTGNEQSKKRTRPGKKYRIKLRRKFAAKQAQKDAKKAADEAKEVAEREKRTRRNREKKVKRKAKEKAKKEGTGDVEAVEADEDRESET